MVSSAQEPDASLMCKERQREVTVLTGAAFLLVARQSQNCCLFWRGRSDEQGLTRVHFHSLWAVNRFKLRHRRRCNPRN